MKEDRVSQQFIARFTMLATKSFLKNGIDFSQELISGWVNGLHGPDYACDYFLPSNTAENACEIQSGERELLGAQHPDPLGNLSNGARTRQGQTSPVTQKQWEQPS